MHLFRSILNAHFLRYVTLVIVACFGFFGNTILFVAAEEGTAATATYTNTDGSEGSASSATYRATLQTQGVETKWINGLNMLIAFVSFLYVPFSMLASWLISPDWTFGDFIGLRPILHQLWIFVSNTVYVIFAAMLIVVAIANIFGQSDSYAIKKMLPRFVIGVIMVPFTWWVVSATLSVSSYMTALVVRMPADIITAGSKSDFKIKAYTGCTLDFRTTSSSKIWDCSDEPEEIPFSQYSLNGKSAYGIIPLYAYNVFRFDEIDQFKDMLGNKGAAYDAMSPAEQAQFDAAKDDEKSIMLQAAMIATTLGKVIIQMGMSVLFAMVFMVILIALVIVLFTRVIRMWMYAIFSPLFALRYFLSDKVDKDGLLSKFEFKEFIGLAMVPVTVSAALGFGFMFLMVFQQKLGNGGTTQGLQSDYVKVSEAGAGGHTGSVDFFGTKISIILPETATKNAGSGGDDSAKFSSALFGLLAGLITPILGIIVLWLAVMAGMKTSKATTDAVKGIEDFGGQVAGMAKKIPGFLPVPGMTVKDAQGNSKQASIKHLFKVKEGLMNLPQKWDAEAHNEVQRTWFNEKTMDDISNSVRESTNAVDAIRKITDELNRKGISSQAGKSTPQLKLATDALADTQIHTINKDAFKASMETKGFRQAMIEALEQEWFKVPVTNKASLIKELKGMTDSDNSYAKILNLVGGSTKPSGLTKDSFKYSTANVNRKIQLNKQHRTDGNQTEDQDIEIPASITTKSALKSWLSGQFDFTNDSELNKAVDELAGKLSFAP